MDASHDANRDNKAECSPETRTRILKELDDWVDDPNPEYKIIWLYGPAGAGKSAIAQSVMKRAHKEGRLGASFFFSRGAAGRSTSERLFSTIAYQLSKNIPALAQSVEGAMLSNRDIPLLDLETQFELLIDHPSRQCTMSMPYPLVGIDGVDECDNDRVQEKFLAIIGDSVKSQTPVRFLISSRPEPRIQALFKKIKTYTRTIVLETSIESLDDISKYLHAGFAEIRERHSHFMRGISKTWPSEEDLKTLRQRSSGHFIYAATVLKFVGDSNDHLNPISQLNIILRQSPEMTPALRASPYSELDRLYLHVLSRHRNPLQLLQILTFFLVPNFRPFPDFLDDLLDIDQGTVVASLSCLHSLINFSESDSVEHPSTFHHASFQDFLLNSSRSQTFHINTEQSKLLVTKACLELLIRWIGNAST